MVWVNLILIAVGSIILVFVVSFAEGAAWSVSSIEVMAFKNSIGTGNQRMMRKITLAQKLIADRMTTVNFILLMLDTVLYIGPLLSGFVLAHVEMNWAHGVFLWMYPLVRFFAGEIISKNLGYKHRVWFMVYFSCVLVWLLRVFVPVTRLLRLLNRFTGVKGVPIKEEHVIATARAAAETKAIAPGEADLIERVIAVGNKKVRDLMVPLSECIRVPMKVKLGQLVASMGSDKKDLPVLVINEKEQVVGHLSADDAVDVMYRTHDDVLNLSVAGEGTVHVDANAYITTIFPTLKKAPVGIVEDAGKVVGVIILKDVITAMTGASDFE
ncbi:MAG TPA: CNNM domain-containing protein [Candidatus Magasanikbacteria bacterium]|nr:CNNM domain-containing protein [Candidatus Magasanikbacteria bacterium]